MLSPVMPGPAGAEGISSADHAADAAGARCLECGSRAAMFSFLLPVGKYKFYAYGADVKTIQQDLTVPADKTELDLQTLDVPATVIAKHKGKTPPAWHVSDARGVKK